MFDHLKKLYSQKGFFIIKNVLKDSEINELNNEIGIANNVDKYFDKKGQIRRIERIFDKGENLYNLNLRIVELLKKIFEESFTIFKDKFNAKPPGGEGFFAHYDGIFEFKDNNLIKRKGWYEYTDIFVNILIALDSCSKENGTIEISNIHNDSFENLLLNTKQDGTPDLLEAIEKSSIFESIELAAGDVVIFSNQCPHRSKKNYSSSSRRTLYYTYTPEKFGSFYEKYFFDKKNSKNTKSKSLSGEI